MEVLVPRSLPPPSVVGPILKEDHVCKRDTRASEESYLLEGRGLTMSDYFTVDASFTYELESHEAGITPFLDSVEQELFELGTDDVLIVADEEAQSFMVSVLVAAPVGQSIETVVGTAMGLLRTSFHACDGGTQDWPTPKDALRGVRVKHSGVDVQPSQIDGAGGRALALA